MNHTYSELQDQFFQQKLQEHIDYDAYLTALESLSKIVDDCNATIEVIKKQGTSVPEILPSYLNSRIHSMSLFKEIVFRLQSKSNRAKYPFISYIKDLRKLRAAENQSVRFGVDLQAFSVFFFQSEEGKRQDAESRADFARQVEEYEAKEQDSKQQ